MFADDGVVAHAGEVIADAALTVAASWSSLQASAEIEERGGKPFFEDQVPRAVIRFKQGVGRLIRSGDDTGRVVVLDPRIVTKGYGRSFQKALPEGVEVEPLEPLAIAVDDYDGFDDWDGDDAPPGDVEHPGGFDALD